MKKFIEKRRHYIRFNKLLYRTIVCAATLILINMLITYEVHAVVDNSNSLQKAIDSGQSYIELYNGSIAVDYLANKGLLVIGENKTVTIQGLQNTSSNIKYTELHVGEGSEAGGPFELTRYSQITVTGSNNTHLDLNNTMIIVKSGANVTINDVMLNAANNAETVIYVEPNATLTLNRCTVEWGNNNGIVVYGTLYCNQSHILYNGKYSSLSIGWNRPVGLGGNGITLADYKNGYSQDNSKIVLNGCTIQGNYTAGINIDFDRLSNSSNSLEVYSSLIYDNGWQGITLRRNNQANILDTYIDNNGLNKENKPNTDNIVFNSYPGIDLQVWDARCPKLSIERVTVTRNSGNNIQLFSGLSVLIKDLYIRKLANGSGIAELNNSAVNKLYLAILDSNIYENKGDGLFCLDGYTEPLIKNTNFYNNQGSGLSVQLHGKLYMRNVQLHDNGYNGLYSWGGLDVEDCSFYNNKEVGLWNEFWPDLAGITIRNVDLHDNKAEGSWLLDKLTEGGDYTSQWAGKQVIIENINCYNNGELGISLVYSTDAVNVRLLNKLSALALINNNAFNGIYTQKAKVTIEEVDVYDNNKSREQNSGLEINSGEVTVINSKFHGKTQLDGVYLLAGKIYADNIQCYLNGGLGILLGNAASGSYVHNSILTDNSLNGLYAGNSNVEVLNLRSYNNGESGILIDKNLNLQIRKDPSINDDAVGTVYNNNIGIQINNSTCSIENINIFNNTSSGIHAKDRLVATVTNGTIKTLDASKVKSKEIVVESGLSLKLLGNAVVKSEISKSDKVALSNGYTTKDFDISIYLKDSSLFEMGYFTANNFSGTECIWLAGNNDVVTWNNQNSSENQKFKEGRNTINIGCDVPYLGRRLVTKGSLSDSPLKAESLLNYDKTYEQKRKQYDAMTAWLKGVYTNPLYSAVEDKYFGSLSELHDVWLLFRTDIDVYLNHDDGAGTNIGHGSFNTDDIIGTVRKYWAFSMYTPNSINTDSGQYDKFYNLEHNIIGHTDEEHSLYGWYKNGNKTYTSIDNIIPKGSQFLDADVTENIDINGIQYKRIKQNTQASQLKKIYRAAWVLELKFIVGNEVKYTVSKINGQDAYTKLINNPEFKNEWKVMRSSNGEPVTFGGPNADGIIGCEPRYYNDFNTTFNLIQINESDLLYIINTHLDWGANNGLGRVKIAWDNSELIKHPNAGYRTWVLNNNESYDLTDPLSWTPVQSVSSQEQTEPIYVVNLYNDIARWIVAEDPVANAGVRVGVLTTEGNYFDVPKGNFQFNAYDSNGNSTGQSILKVLPLSALLKLWMEGGTVSWDTTYTPGGIIYIDRITSDASGKAVKYETVYDPYRFQGSQTYGNYGKSPYDNKQLIRVIPISFLEFYASLNGNNSSIIKYNLSNLTYTIKIDGNAFYDPNGREVLVDIVYMGTWDGTTDMYPTAVGTLKYQEGLRFIQGLINSGTPVVFGHDTNMMLNDENIKYFGIDSNIFTDKQFYAASQNVVIKDSNSPILQTPYKFEAGQVIKVPFSHLTSQVYLGETLAEFLRTPATSVTDGNLQFYAGTGDKQAADTLEFEAKQKHNNPDANAYTYAGVYKNTALIQVGHTTGKSSDDMNKLITNILFYLKLNSKKSVFIDDRTYDKNSPTKITYGNILKLGTTVDVNFKAAQDVGTNYYYVLQFFKPGNGSETDFINQSNKTLAQSNVAEQNVRSGVKKYYYIIDNNPGTVITKDMLNSSEIIGSEILEEHKVISGSQYNKLYNFLVEIPYKSDTFWYNNGFEMEQVNQKVVVDESELQNRNYTLEFEYDTKYLKLYVHVAAVDASGNLGDTQTTEVDRPIRVVYDLNQGLIDSVITGDVPDTVYLEYGESITVSNKNSLDAQGYRFLGWSMDKQANTDNIDSILTPGERLLAYDMILDDTRTCTLYAIWLRVDTLTIDPNGGLWTDKYGVEVLIDGSEDYIDKDPTNITYDKPVKFGLSLNDSKKIEDAYKIGYNFYGWKIS